MKAKLLIVAVILIGVGVAACKKDQFTTKPQIKLKSVNTDRVSQNQVLNIVLDVTDKEGDIQDTLFMERIRYSCEPSTEITKYKIADFPSQGSLKAEIAITFYNGLDNPNYNAFITNFCASVSGEKTDSGYYKIWVQDKARNVSDTVKTGIIVIE